jgi:hypothetical protein
MWDVELLLTDLWRAVRRSDGLCRDRPLSSDPSVASDPFPAAITEVAIEVEFPSGARVRVGNGAGASLLCDVFAVLDRR